MLTLKERERRAYIEGRVGEAQLLRGATDATPEYHEAPYRVMRARNEELRCINERLEASVAAMRRREMAR
jgi:hypothetical protein